MFLAQPKVQLINNDKQLKFILMNKHLIPSEISWLSFNQCLLEEASDKNNQLYERIKFLAIHSSNLDEFFRVKINRLSIDKSADKKGLLSSILKEVNHQQEAFGKIWRTEIIPELLKNNILVYEGQTLLDCHKKEMERYFKSTVLSFIQIVFIQHNLPKAYFLNNRSLFFFVKLKSKDGQDKYAYINIPSDKLDRFKTLQNKDNNHYIISLDEIIKNCLHLIFRQDEIISCYAIKMNRDEDYEIEDESTGNLIHKIKGKIEERKSGLPTRFLYDAAMPKDEMDFCRKTFKLKKSEMVAGGKQHNLFDLFKFPNPVKPKLQSPFYPALNHVSLDKSTSIFEAIDSKNQLLHFPYHSYHYVLQFFNEAAIDDRVTAIKVTLYRISAQSLIANALISAAKNGKKVTVFVEVKARFDENNNLHWANEMKKAGIKIIYSMPNLKVHAKIALVTMQIDENSTKNYSYLATGNFNESTATIYADHGFFTSEKKYTKDIAQVFQFLKTKNKKAPMENLLVAGFLMKEQLIQFIDTETENHKNGKPSGILLKVNGIDDKIIIEKLYEASQAGVSVTLLVRGICRLKPGVKGLSENISVYRIVDMFLEHARIFHFTNGGNEKIYLSSADMMGRNLNNRIEVAFPVEDEDLKQELKQIIQFQLADNTKKRSLDAEGINVRNKEISETPKRAQLDTYKWLQQKNL